MAEFCNKCSDWHGFPRTDIDIPKLFNDLKPETYFPVLCEGCSMQAVGKDKDGELIVAFFGEKNDEGGIWHKRDINDYKYKTEIV